MSLPSSHTWAQAVLQGRVVDQESREALPFVNIVVKDYLPTLGTTTDDRGRFSLIIPSDTALLITVTFTGHLQAELPIRLGHGQKVDTVLSISTAATIKAAVVHGDMSRTTAFTTISNERLEHISSPTSGVEALLKTLPDVSSNNELSSQYSVRGGSFDENLVYINGIEIYRPMLIRSGQQEGMSIINSDMIDNIVFSPGGFDATFGDKMASVLSLLYSRPTEFKAKATFSFLGATAATQGLLGSRKQFSYSFGFRQHSNSYLFRSLDTKGAYSTRYTDFQTILGYRINDYLDISFLGIASHNIYDLIPESQTTVTGGFFETMQFQGYFDGQELDHYRTALGGLTFNYHPSADFQLQWITSAQRNKEQEIYDIQCQYWLYEVNIGSTDPDNELFERGVGTYLEHARNRLTTNILSSELQATHFASLGQWDIGIRFQHESFDDQVREWKWVDSAGYAYPLSQTGIPGDSANQPANPLLQKFCSAHNLMSTNRGLAYLQRSINILTRRDEEIRILIGLRGQLYSTGTEKETTPIQTLLSPRASVSYAPKSQHDVIYRLALGLYHQPPFYREYRRDDGSLNLDVTTQHSYQIMGTTDWNLNLWKKPFHFTADIYYKYITDLIPYRIDNLRVRYDANNEAVAYAAGLSLRISGEFVEGLESWASLSLMQTQEDILTDNLGWLTRPTDQRFSFKVYLQDYVPRFPFWRMNLNLVYGSGLPYTSPTQTDRTTTYRMPSYYRIDWGNTIELTKFDKIKRLPFFRSVSDVSLSFEIFNLFDYRNVVSYTWVVDYSNLPYHIPNILTGRQINLKLSVTF